MVYPIYQKTEARELNRKVLRTQSRSFLNVAAILVGGFILGGACHAAAAVDSAAPPVGLCIEVTARETMTDWIASLRIDPGVLNRYGLIGAHGAPRLKAVEVSGGAEKETPVESADEDGQIVLRVPLAGRTAAGGKRVFRLEPADARQFPAEAGAPVQRKGDRIVVKTHYFQAVHDLSQGGLLASVAFSGAQTPWDVLMGDRLYSKARGAFPLSADHQARLVSMKTGPLTTELVFSARYLGPDGDPTPSGVSAEYRYRYFATLPFVTVEARIRQPTLFHWDELHVLAMRTKQSYFDRYALGEPFEQGPLRDQGKGHQLTSKAWGALFNAQDAVALTGGPLYGIHDGLSHYGVYVHGPWVSWNDSDVAFRRALYLGPSGADGREIQRMIGRWNHGVQVRLLRPEIEQRAAELRARLDFLRRSTASAVADGLLAAALAASRRGGPDGKTKGLLTAVEHVVAEIANGRPQSPPFAFSTPGGGALLATGSTMLLFETTRADVELASIRNLATGHEYLLHPASNLWRIVFKSVGKDDRVEVAAADARSCSITVQNDTESPAVALEWRELRSGPIRIARVTLTVRADTDATRWSLAFDGCEHGPGLWDVEFPNLSGIGTPGGDDQLLVPQKWGRILEHASLGARYRRTYPSGRFNMQFFAYFAERNGLFLAALDPDARSKVMDAAPAPDGGLRLDVHLWPENMGRRRANWRMPYPTVLRAFTGDWFDAAKLYRSWALKQKWCAQGPLWSRSEQDRKLARFLLNYRPTLPEDEPPVLRMADALHAPAFAHVYNWHRIPFDNNYPEYFPPKPVFPEFVRKSHARGIAVMPYINGRLWDTDTDSWRDEHGGDAAARREDGGLYLEHWSKQKHAVMCPWTWTATASTSTRLPPPGRTRASTKSMDIRSGEVTGGWTATAVSSRKPNAGADVPNPAFSSPPKTMPNRTWVRWTGT